MLLDNNCILIPDQKCVALNCNLNLLKVYERKFPTREQANNDDYQGTAPQSLVVLENHIIKVLKMNKNYIKNPIKGIFNRQQK